MEQIDLGHGYFALVDDEDFTRVFLLGEWHVRNIKHPTNETMYATCSPHHHENIQMHRFILGAKEGDIVDHKNGNGLDNRKDNLRLVTWQQSNLNKKRRKDRPFKQKGVRKVNDKYRAYVSVNKKQIHLGYYNTPEEAGKVVEEYMTRLHGPDYVPDTR